eukprot:CAMPEP_0194478438 /NCGR_PEP_ID=MMETSP0253-20130528/1878_1 /TAXON_ID=2966 /ORGANISM="Noctiluca scintillans" /LENGTH=156 /DNA_ID=CAMNT_0039317521 /DNA_START=34 /DNA_END=504 /DNA_ORIENTATION=+
MGYAGYSPGANSRVADKLTPLQQALRKLPLEQAPETLDLIEKLTRNVIRNPADDKFRHIKLSNPRIAAAITDVPNAVDVLREMGWQEDSEGLVLPSGVRLAFEREVVDIIDVRDFYKKEAEKERKRQLDSVKEVDPEKAALLQQVEADRRTRILGC